MLIYLFYISKKKKVSMSFIQTIALSIILMFSPLTATVAQAQDDRFVLVSHAPDSDSWWNTIKNAIREAGELVLSQSALASSNVCNIEGLKAGTPYINTTNILKDGKAYDPGQACHKFYPDTEADTVGVSTQYKLNDGNKCRVFFYKNIPFIRRERSTPRSPKKPRFTLPLSAPLLPPASAFVLGANPFLGKNLRFYPKVPIKDYVSFAPEQSLDFKHFNTLEWTFDIAAHIFTSRKTVKQA